MVAEGIRYGVAFSAAAVLAGLLLGWWFALPLAALALFLMYFFRDPERQGPTGAALAVSPADGRVVDIRNTELQGQAVRRISIFLSPMDVHVNRSPVAGVVRRVEYCPGRFHVASRPEASSENECNTVTVEGPDGTVVFKQIAGILARRIVFWKKEGDTVDRGERIGLMKFSSRMDVFLDNTWQIVVQAGARVSAGVTVLARKM